MKGLYPAIEPYEHGMLDVGDGNLVYWETCGNPNGKPAVVLHGGPGSGCTEWHRRLFDSGAYRVVLLDQRNCRRSTPNASEPDVDLASNTTPNLVADIELLRERLGVERWLVLGGSWGVAAFFPEQWERLLAALPVAKRDGDVVEAYHQLLFDPDAAVRERAALEWCMWESATPAWPPAPGLAPRFTDPKFALALARLVTHYVRHDAWIENGSLLRDASVLAGIPGILVNGRFDFQAPIANAWELKRVWPRAELVIIDDAGHAADNARITNELIRATDRFTRR